MPLLPAIRFGIGRTGSTRGTLLTWVLLPETVSSDATTKLVAGDSKMRWMLGGSAAMLGAGAVAGATAGVRSAAAGAGAAFGAGAALGAGAGTGAGGVAGAGGGGAALMRVVSWLGENTG